VSLKCSLKTCLILVLGVAFGLGLGAVSGPAQAETPGLTALEELTVFLYDHAVSGMVTVTTQEVSRNDQFSLEPLEGIASGFVYDTAGHIVTNNHVIAGADTINVILPGGTTVKAQVVGSDERADLAVLQVTTTEPLSPLQLGNSADLKTGQLAIALGNPFGLEKTMTLGIISAVKRTLKLSKNRFFVGSIQTDAAINPGNSGGPLLDIHGRVIGIDTLIFTPSPNGGSAGLGFAVPAEIIARVVPALIKSGRYDHPWLGIKTATLTPRVAKAIEATGAQLGAQQGVLIEFVESNSPAAQAGLQGGKRTVRSGPDSFFAGGDVIIGIDGVPVKREEDLIEHLELLTSAGQTITLELMRQGQPLQVQVTVGTEPMG